ncbi:MAG: hypothetical protein AB7G17_07205 [Phycisphaerales bacterium]
MKDRGEVSGSFNQASWGSPGPQSGGTEGLASKQRMEELYGKLSQPRLVFQRTPMGAITRQVRNEKDAKLLAEIERIRERLDRRRNRARDDFNRAHDGPDGDHLRPRRKM